MKNVNLLLIVLSLFLLLFLNTSAFCRPESGNKRAVTISLIEGDFIHGIIKDIVRTAYKKIGYDISFYELPARRSLEWANSGKTDGDLARIDGINRKYGNLIKINTPLFTIKGVVFTKKINRDVRSWNDLKDLNIGIRNGIRYCEIGTRGFNRIKAQDLPNLFTLLANDRIDVAVADYDIGRYEIAKNFKGSNIHIIGHPLKSSHLYHYIHKKNKSLETKLEKVLIEMTNGGEIERIRDKAITEILNR